MTNLTLERYVSEPIEIEKELSILFPDRNAPLIIFDVGACEGEDSIKYKLRYPESSVTAFEPLPKNVNRAKKHFRQYSLTNDILLENIAVSDRKGEATFYVSSGQPRKTRDSNWDYGNKSSSLLPPDKTLEVHSWLKFKDKVKVKTETLANYCDRMNIEAINFMHIDVQGAELMVLKGAGQLIVRVDAIWLEVENIPLYKNQPLKKSVEEFMERNGFIKVKDSVNDIAGDQLYINRRRVSRLKRLRLKIASR